MVEIRSWIEENRALSLVLAVFMAAQLFLIFSIWNKPLLWDSSVYIATGKFIYSLGEYGFWSSYRGIGIPLVVGLFWKLGAPMIGFPRLIGLAISSLGITAFYLMTDRIFGRTEAIATSGIVAASHAYFFFTPEVLTGIPSSILVFASLYMVTRKRYFAGGFLAASAFIFRYPAALVGPAAVIFILARSAKNRDFRAAVENLAKFSTAVMVTVAPYLVLLYFQEGSILTPFLESASFTASAGTTYSAGLYYILQAVKTNPLNIFLPVGIYAVLRNSEWEYGGFLSGLAIFYLFFMSFPLKIERYILPFLPLIAVFSARGVKESIGLAKQRFDQNLLDNSRWLIVAAVLAVMGYSFFASYAALSYPLPQEQTEFFNEVSGLEGEVATNDPRANLYADFRYYTLPPDWTMRILESHGDTIDHWAINGCYWDCRGVSGCQDKIQEFESTLEQRYGKSFEARRNTCNYTIYSR